jgi:hypothetical protein
MKETLCVISPATIDAGDISNGEEGECTSGG